MSCFRFVSVFKCVIARILDIPNYDPETSRSSTIVTLHQMMVFFNDEGRKDMPDYIENLAAESKYMFLRVSFPVKLVSTSEMWSSIVIVNTL